MCTGSVWRRVTHCRRVPERLPEGLQAATGTLSQLRTGRRRISCKEGIKSLLWPALLARPPHSSASPAARMLPFLPHSQRPALPARLPPSSLSPETTFRVTRGDECCWRSNDGATNCLWHKIQHAFLNRPQSSSACLTDRGGSAGEAYAWIPVGWLRNFRNRVKFWRHNSDFTISQF